MGANYHKRLRTVVDTNANRFLKLKSHLAKTVTLLTFIQCIQAARDKKPDQIRNVFKGMLQAILIASTVYLHLCQTTASETATFINGLLQLDQMYLKSPNKPKDMSLQELLSKLHVKTLQLSLFVIPAGVTFGLHWSTNWKATLAGYWLIPKSNSSDCTIAAQVYLVVTKFIVLVINFWGWMLVFGAGIFVNSSIHNLSIAAILRNIKM